MSEFKMVDLSLAEAVAQTGISYPNPHPYTDVSLLVVAWNESERIAKLLGHLKPYFEHSVICVQESTDGTADIAREVMDRPTDQVIDDRHWGHGDASFPRMVKAARTEWCFVVSCDEWPTAELLDSLWSAIAVGGDHNEAVWFRFRSWIEDIETSGDHGHLRLFRKRVGWPNKLHSRPMTQRAIWWPHGWFEHRRSLDEMMRDYLSYYRIGRGSPGWEMHNKLMMHDACVLVATHVGWDKVTAYEWWPQVRALAFTAEETPWQT